MGKIIQLDNHLANMIAAGEVVEKPYSVVKELVENSIDANAKNITITLQDSGMTMIDVLDDGDGMSQDDALMAFKRHATSKIKNEHDLYRINSLGFRGEAIPSIASVSLFELSTNNGLTNGYKVTYKAGKMINEESVSMNKGTHIKVSNLFFNTPARLKYIKSLNTELAYITELIDKLALANKDVRFKLINNQKVLFQSNGQGNMQSLIANIYGIEAAKNLLYKEAFCPGVEIKLYLVKSIINKSRKNDIILICNKRYVRNTNLINALIDGYKTYLPQFRYPIAVIDIKIDPLLIDVNVHPSKLEIKFSEEDVIKYTITNATIDALKETEMIPNYNIGSKVDSYTNEKVNLETKYETQTLNFNLEKYDEPTYQKNHLYDVKKEYSFEKNEEKIKQTPNISNTKKEDYRKTFPSFEYIGTLHVTYLLFQNEEGLFLVDQHAAEERINYEYYYHFFEKESVQTIDLLIPINVNCTKNELLFLLENKDKLTKIGFHLEESGLNSFFIRSIPTYIKNNNVEEIVKKIIYYMIEKNSVDMMILRDSLAKMIACKKSIKANHKINLEEINTLINNLKKCDNPYTCPHGRPTIVKLTTYEIEKLFKRVM